MFRCIMFIVDYYEYKLLNTRTRSAYSPTLKPPPLTKLLPLTTSKMWSAFTHIPIPNIPVMAGQLSAIQHSV